MDEHTVGLIPSMNNTVIIPTAGTGSRMGKYIENLNKSLLSFKGKPMMCSYGNLGTKLFQEIENEQ